MKNKDEFIGMLDDWLAKGDIEGQTINQTNLDRFNQANIMAFTLFKPIEVEIGTPQNLSFAEASIIAERVEFEGAKERSSYIEFIQLIDYYNVSPVSSTKVMISWNVDGVWEE